MFDPKAMMHTDGTLTIRVNGEHRRVAAGMTLADLANEIGLAPEKVAVERNLAIVPRSTLAEVRIEDGDELEIVHFVGGGMAASRIVPNRYAPRASEGRAFFVDILGLEVAMELPFITTYRAPGNAAAQISVLSGDPSGLEPAYSVGVDDVDSCHRRAVEDGHEIVYPMTDEPWGVRRFFVRDPLGAVANIVGHREP